MPSQPQTTPSTRRRVFGWARGSVLAGLTLFGLVSWLEPFDRNAHAGTVEAYDDIQLLGDVLDRIRSSYVEKPDDQKLIEGAIDGMVSSLDPHSRYVPARDYEKSQAQLTGQFGGLGIEVTQDGELLKIVSAMDGTPAAKAGLLANDVIVAIDDEPVEDLSLAQAAEKMRGPIDTPVALTIRRGAVDAQRRVDLIRKAITLQSTEVELKHSDIGYIRISKFTEQTFPGLETGLTALADSGRIEGLKGFVLDLRNNPGGLVDQAVGVADSFLDRGQILSTRGRGAEESDIYFAEEGDLLKGKPLIVLINAGSASASEIVAGALQDHRRATVLGTRSFGKGTVQTIIPLSEAGAIYLTTGRYFTPSGRSIQAKGIDPDIRVEEKVPDAFRLAEKDFGEKSLKGHLANPETNAGPGPDDQPSPAYVPPDEKDDTQLNTAIRLLKGEETNASFPPIPEAYTQLAK